MYDPEMLRRQLIVSRHIDSAAIGALDVELTTLGKHPFRHPAVWVDSCDCWLRGWLLLIRLDRSAVPGDFAVGQSLVEFVDPFLSESCFRQHNRALIWQ